MFTGLRRDAINVVITDRIPVLWDHGRGWKGASTRQDGYDLCVIALAEAHGHQVPFLSVNTCVHELLHVLFQDLSVRPPKQLPRAGRELRIDWYATLLWLFHEGDEIRKAARAYVARWRGSRA